MGGLHHQPKWPIVILIVIVVVASSSTAWVHPQRQREKPSRADNQSHRLPKIFNYELYLQKHQKSPFFQRPLKFLNRARLFIGRTLEIFKHNTRYALNNIDHYLRQNLFTDMTVREITSHFVSRNTGLRPVTGADTNPNLPAEDYMAQINDSNLKSFAVEETETDDDDSKVVYEDFSQADLSELPAERTGNHQQIARHQTSGLDFLHEQQVSDQSAIDITRVMNEFNIEPHMARRVSRLLVSGSKTAESKMVQKQLDSINRARELQGIVSAPIVESNNKHFDPSLLMSQSLLGSVTEYLMGGYPAGGDYSAAGADSDEAPPEDPEEAERMNRSLFASLVDKMVDYFAEDTVFDYGDESEEEEEFEDANESFDNSDEDDDEGEHHEDAPPLDGKSNGIAKSGHKIPGRIKFDIDWRQTGCVSRPKHQINCNSCYAFATLDLMEFFYCRQKKTYTEFSAQYIIDCGHKTNLNGCQGGKISNVGMFIRSHGIQLNSMYPYQGAEKHCPFDESSDREQRSFVLKPKITGWRMFNQIDAWYKWLPKTPIIVGINMPSDFLAYGGGIHDGHDCIQGMGHAMLLVGSGKQDGKSFWLLKNSFSNEWGEAGYFRLSKRAPLKCFNSVIVARANFNVLVN